MAVFTQAQKNEVKDGETIPVRRKEFPQLLFVSGRCFHGVHLARHPVDVGRRDGDMIEKEFPGHPVVAVRVIGGHASLIPPEEMDAGPGDL